MLWASQGAQTMSGENRGGLPDLEPKLRLGFFNLPDSSRHFGIGQDGHLDFSRSVGIGLDGQPDILKCSS